ncbi:tRNA pseudouridine(38-40) synthase TruA [Clostridium sp. Marseille-Q7071]
MKNIKLIVEYDGTNYSGWQKQNNNITVQGTLEEILSELTKEKIEIIGCSRTDSKVHARKYICNFHTNSTIPSHKFREALNVGLPCDIAILESSEVPLNFHARYDCIGKKYSYTILERSVKATIDRNFTYQCKYNLDIAKMQEATKHFIGTHDFSAFRNNGSSVKTSTRNITELKVEKLGNYVKIYASADGFLYNMVRIIVGTLVDVGTNKIKPETIIDIINSKDRSEAGKTAPPQGLCLEEVYY